MAAYVVGIPSVTKKITVNRPGREEEEFFAEIRVRDRDEQEALRAKEKKEIKEKQKRQEKARKEGKEVEEDDTGLSDSQFREDLLSVSGLEDTKGNTVESTPDLLDKMIKDPYAGLAIMRAWHEVQRGLPESTAKN